MTTTEPARYPEKRLRAAAVRSRLMLQIASVLVADEEWPDQQVRVQLRPPGHDRWATAFFASDGAESVDAVLDGEADFAIINPATAVRPALSRRPGTRGDELAAIATIPSYDQLGLAVPSHLGITTLTELAEAKPALRVSLRGGRPTHNVHMVLDDVLASAGISLDDIEAWGGRISYDEGIPDRPVRSGLLRDGAIDAIFDEGVYNWVEIANRGGLTFLSIGPDSMATLTEQGYRGGLLRRERYRTLESDVQTVDFSGFLVFTRSDVGDATVEKFCTGMIGARDLAGWQGGSTLPLDQMCRGTVDAPIPLPMHPAADRVWRRMGLR